MPNIDWKDFLGLNNGNVEEMRVIAYAYLRQGKYDLALKIFEAVNVFEPDNVSDVEIIGALYLQLGNASEAITHLEKAISLQPGNQYALLNKAKAFFTLGHREKGIDMVKNLEKSKDQFIANQATALHLAYGNL